MPSRTSHKRQTASAASTLQPFRAFFAAAVLYFFVSFRGITQWTLPVWVILVFVAVPIAAAFAGGRAKTAGARIRASMVSAGFAMAFYSAMSLMRVHAKLGSAPNAGSTFLVGLCVAIVYGLIASFVCAITGLILDRAAVSKGAE